MNKNYLFYECHLEREMASEGDPGLFAATEVVRAACNANFQRNGFYMRSLPSSPHCYYKYAKLPKDGMYMLWAVKKTNMTTLDILVDTRMFPNLVMIEKNTDWQAETEEVKGAVEKVISDDTNPYNWNFNLEIYSACGTQYLDEFHSALAYMREPNYIYEDYNSNMNLKGLFEGGNFTNAQINVVTGDGVQISYESTNKKESEVTNGIKQPIMDYVNRLMPVVRQQYQAIYNDMWYEILELKEVKMCVYNKGKQQGTTFNRDFVAQIIHLLGDRVYLPNANTVVMAEYLELGKGKDHPVRQKLGEMPEKVVGKAIEKLIKAKI